MDERELYNIVLIGYRGCGKTTVGHLIAQRLGWRFVDTDLLIEEQAGMSIAELFARRGEPEFRRLEVEKVAEVTRGAGQVLSVGGGAVLDPGNVARLRAAGAVVWLRAPEEVLWRRMAEDDRTARTRPDLTDQGGIEEVRAVLSQREPAYRSAADIEVDTDGRTPEEVAAVVLKGLPDRLQR